MINNIIFDFGNVLVDYNSHRIFDRYFGDVSKAEWFRETIILKDLVKHLDIGEDFNDCIKRAQDTYPEYSEAIALYSSDYYEMDGGEISGMYELLSALSNKGYRLYGLTNWSYKVYEIIKKHPIFRLLKGYVISSEIHMLKPNPDIYNHLVRKFSVNPKECLFVDDKMENVKGAEAVGMYGVRFVSSQQLAEDLRQLSILI